MQKKSWWNMGLKKILSIFASIFLGSLQASNIYVDAELLYCHALIDDLGYALHVNTEVEDLSLQGTTDEKNVHFGWNPGVRVGIGSEFCSNWSIDLVGTYLHSKAKDSDSAPIDSGTEFLHTLWFQSFTGFRAASAEANWNLDFGTLDLLGAYRLNFMDCFIVAPYFGLRAAWIRQHYEIDYHNVLFSTMEGDSLSFDGSHVDMISRHRAIGFTTGSDFAVALSRCLSFDAAIGGSLVYGPIRISEGVIGAFPIPLDDIPVLIDTDLMLPKKEFQISANLETEAGFCYRTFWNCHPVELFFGYFFSIWFEQNAFDNLVFTVTNIVNVELQDNLTTIENKHSNLQIQGLLLGGSISF